jgi:alpha-amylase/alpha-mannosidase (GH57 family)
VRRGNTLKHISPGSWINGDFKIWIGHPEDNKAWDLLFQARGTLEQLSRKRPASAATEAYKEIMIAEGSDWCWWYGDEHKSPNANQFDDLFRYHLKQVYSLLGAKPPAELDEPIKKKVEQFCRQPRRMTSPKFDTPDTEWENAGIMERVESDESMQKTGALIERLYFGNDLKNIYLRIDTTKKISNEKVVISFLSNPKTTLEIGKDFVFRTEGSPRDFRFAGRYFIGNSIQVAINFGDTKPDTVALSVSIYDNDSLIDSFPAQGTAKFRIAQ